jgi:Ca2+-binding RTX toxin-like protein
VANAPLSSAAEQSCRSYSSPAKIGELSKYSINEASGLIASRTHSNKYWLHNDSGDSARIFAMNVDGEDRGTVNLGSTSARDFEDIAIGDGPNGKDYLYIADIGNNGKGRETVLIHRIVEPVPPGKGKSITIPKSQITTFEIAYEKPGGGGATWRRNAESLFVDPRSGHLFIIEKHLQTVDGKANMGWVYLLDKDTLSSSKVNKAKPKVAIRQVRNADKRGPMTGADISPDGSLIIAKNGAETFAWERGSGQSVIEAFAAHPISTCWPPDTPGEAIAFTPDGTKYLSVTEKRHAPVYRISISGGGGGTPPPPTTTNPPPTTTKPPGSYTPTCDGRAATIVGTSGNDVLKGTSGVDVIVGLGGNDVIYGYAGNDYLCGHGGDDKIYGGKGNDTMHGGDGNDYMVGSDGDDFMVGNRGSDDMYGGAGSDYMAGTVGNDMLVGGDDPDQLMAGTGTDECVGGHGNDDYQSCEKK